MKYDDPIEYNGHKLTDKYIASLNKKEREKLIDPLTDIFFDMGFKYPDDISKIDKEWKRILAYEPDLNTDEVYNNDSRGTYICKFFCKDFYNAKSGKNKNSLVSIAKDKELIRRIINNRLGLLWYDEVSGTDGTFSMSPKMVFFQGPRSMRLTNQLSIYKITVHKYLCAKYSKPGDRIFDYSAGWGARMLAAASLDNREYVGVDPLTIPDLIRMKDYLKLKNITLVQEKSENYDEGENCMDFISSSPPFFDQEIYSENLNQANNNGEDYFYNVYWKKTLENAKNMLKPNKWFGLNVVNYPKMVDMANDIFGEPVEIIKLKTTKSHLNKTGKHDAIKFEPIYMYLNEKH